MALTIEQLRERTNYIGSSDVPALLGVDKYRNLADLYAEKAGLVELSQTTNPAADWGDRLEGVLVEWIAERVGEEAVRGERRSSADGILRAQLDGWLPSLGETIECKTSGLLNAMFRAEEEGWGRDGTDELPFRVLAQVQFALMLSRAPRGHVAAFLGGGTGPRHYVVEAHAGLQEEIERRARAFWTEHVTPRVPPTEIPSIDTLKSLRREVGKVVVIDENLPDEWLAAAEALREAQGRMDEVKKRVLVELGDAEEGVTPFGGWSYRANARGVRSLRFNGKVSTVHE